MQVLKTFRSLALAGLVTGTALFAQTLPPALGNGDLSTPLSTAVPGSDGAVNTEGSWIFFLNNGATGDAVLENGEVKVTPNVIKAPPYGIQLIQSPVELLKGADYELSFDARSTANRNIVIKVGGTAGRSWTAYSGERKVGITPTMTRYAVKFSMAGLNDANARVEFWFTETAQPVWLDNIVLTQTKGPDLTPAPVSGTKTKADEDKLVKWELEWSDEFNGKTIDPSKWTFELGNNGGWGNNELQFYTDKPANASIQKVDGASVLAITARKEGTTYTSARMVTKDKYVMNYGKIEIRAKLPQGQGIWPALWMLGADIDTKGWPGSGEIDIMEFLGHDTKTIYSTLHGPVSGGQGFGKPYVLSKGDFSSAFHTFTMEWYPSHIEFLVDGQLFFLADKARTIFEKGKQEWVYDHPYFLIFNVAVGGNWPGQPNATTKFPQTMAIDYVRVYHNAGDEYSGGEMKWTD